MKSLQEEHAQLCKAAEACRCDHQKLLEEMGHLLKLLDKGK